VGLGGLKGKGKKGGKRGISKLKECEKEYIYPRRYVPQNEKKTRRNYCRGLHKENRGREEFT